MLVRATSSSFSLYSQCSPLSSSMYLMSNDGGSSLGKKPLFSMFSTYSWSVTETKKNRVNFAAYFYSRDSSPLGTMLRQWTCFMELRYPGLWLIWAGREITHHPITDNPGLSVQLMPGKSKAAQNVCNSNTYKSSFTKCWTLWKMLGFNKAESFVQLLYITLEKKSPSICR